MARTKVNIHQTRLTLEMEKVRRGYRPPGEFRRLFLLRYLHTVRFAYIYIMYTASI